MKSLCDLGYSVLPVPRSVRLQGKGVRVNAGWSLRLDGVEADDIAVRTLVSRLTDEHRITLGEDGPAIGLAVRAGTVDTGTGDGRDGQAYRVDISTGGVALTGNAPAGLFYAVQTFLQLMDGRGGELPLGTIEDWPRFELRCAHWDTKHHQDRMETLRRYLDWAARFKLNGIVFELEDKFEYPTHPVIGAPGAFTTAELQELTDYALERHIEIIPDVQSPAHMCYALKHEELAHLRCDGSNYQICMDDPEARRLLFDMYDDVCEATRGSRYFLVSTDEVYYAGICEEYRKPYNDENRSLTLVDYVNAAHEHLSGKGRRVIVWLEYPLLAEHVKMLPPDILNGVGFRDAGRNAEERKHGIRSFAYVPMQGSELTFPDYFGGHLEAAARAVSDDALKGADPLGIIAAAWDDAGLHNETFWLGWGAAAACGWSPLAPDVEATVAAFMDIYYPGTEYMAEIYRKLQEQARFCENALEKLPSKVRGPSYGHPYWKGPMDRYDRTMMPPATPCTPNDTAVMMAPVFGPRYERVIREAPARLEENERLLERLRGELDRVSRNHYGIEILISIAEHMRHFMKMIVGVADAESGLHRAAALARQGRDDRGALDEMRRARDMVGAIVDDLYATQARLVEVWEKSRLSRNAPADGREFLHVMDDVKDHFADRRPDMTYLIAPEEGIGLNEWLTRLDDVIARFETAIAD